MFSRVGALAITSQRHRRQRAATVTGIVSLGAGVWTNHQKTSLEAGALQFHNPQELIVPTLEAGVRAARLISTVAMIVADYETDKIAAKLFPDRNPELIRWEQERKSRSQELEAAQIAYTSIDKVVVGARRSSKSDQKKAVHDAAERLAEAEEQLAAIGDRKGNVHRKAANRLLKLCRTNGGVYIKIGQHVANLDYLIPPQYIEVLASMFDDAPQSSYADVCKVIEEDLGKHPDELFDNFERTPIASASLAQVHVAYDKKTGRKLAIKCQHRGLWETSRGDLFALTTVVRGVERLFDDFTWGWIADEIAPHLPIELDFLNEGKNAERAAKFIESSGLDCIVPKILWGDSSKRVLCMEFEEGFKATDLDAIEKAGLRKRDIASLISSVFSSQVYGRDSPVHVDPHPANVLIREKNGKPQMVLVDHGLYKDIDNDFRIRYAKLWKSLMLADLKGVQEACKSLGIEEKYTLLAAILTSRPYDEIMERAKTGSLSATIKDAKSDKAMISGYAQHFFQDIIDILDTLPRQMLLLLKMNDCLRHIDFALGSPTNTLVITGKYASRAVYEDNVLHSSSWSTRMSAWVDYMNVLFRIKLHNMTLWWAETTSSLPRLTAS